jgi:Family of unknown function (DUF5691)
LSQAQQDWQTLMALALVGTGRQTSLPAVSNSSITQVLQQVDRSEPEGWLLSTAAILMAYRQAGKLPEAQNIALPEPAHPASESENSHLIESDHPSDDSASLEFGTLLFSQNLQAAIPEFLTLLQEAHQTIPVELLPQFLNWGRHWARRTSNCNTSLWSCLGERGHWLAKLNPEWDYLQQETILISRNSDSAELSQADRVDLSVWQKQWQTGSHSDRITRLRHWRTLDPTVARELLAQTWKQEKAADRSELLRQLQTGLSELDVPFLTLASTDRSQEVKAIAVELLVQFPETDLSQQIQTALRECVQWCKVDDQLELTIKLPKVDDPRWVVYGFLSVAPKQASPKQTTGQRTHLLGQLLSLIPLGFWAEAGTPADLIAAIQDHNYGEMMIAQWADANQKQPDPVWTEVLLQWYKTADVKDEQSTLLHRLLHPLPPEQCQQWLIDWLQPEHWQRQDLHLLFDLCPKPLSLPLSQALLNTVQAYLSSLQTTQKSARVQAQWRLSQQFVPLAYALDSEVLVTFGDIAQLDQTHQVQIFSTIAHILQFRQHMRQAIQNPS